LLLALPVAQHAAGLSDRHIVERIQHHKSVAAVAGRMDQQRQCGKSGAVHAGALAGHRQLGAAFIAQNVARNPAVHAQSFGQDASKVVARACGFDQGL